MVKDYYYLEYHDDAKNSHKFYMGVEYLFNGEIVWGRIGAKGQSKSVSNTKVAEMMREKLKKGYVDRTDEIPDYLYEKWINKSKPSYEEVIEKKPTPYYRLMNAYGLLNWWNFQQEEEEEEEDWLEDWGE
jgi:predicted DNA-binding WGR domain protein